MSETRRWFNLRAGKGKGLNKSSSAKDQGGVTEEVIDNGPPSDATVQRVTAAKNYIEQHYRQQMKTLQDRKERYVHMLMAVRQEEKHVHAQQGVSTH